MSTEEARLQQAEAERRIRLKKNWIRENETVFQRSNTDPEFTVDDLVQVSGMSAQHVRRLLSGAGVGCYAIRPNKNGTPSKTVVIRWSQLSQLASEFNWQQ